MSPDTTKKEFKFETTEETLNYINSVKAKFGMTHEEFVTQAAEFIEENESQFNRRSRGEARDKSRD